MTKLYCPKCGHDEFTNAGKIESSKTRNTRYRCKKCRSRCNSSTILTERPVTAKGKVVAPERPVTLEQLSTEEKLKREVKALKGQVKDLAEEAIDTTRLRKLIHGVAELDSNPPKWMVAHHEPGSHGTPTLFLSDLHWGETVFPQQVNGMNKYNLPIARKRLERVFETTVRLLRDYLVGGNYDGIVLPLGGDMLSGNIHDEIRETNDAQVLTCVADLHDHLVAGIELLVEEFGRVFVPCVVGNHGRMDRKPRAKGAVRDNFEWILYHHLAKHYEGDDRVHVVVSESLDYMYKVHNTRYLLTHGDQFRGGTGIAGPLTPWALGDHRKRKRQDAINQPYDTMIFGHFHQLFWGNGGFLCNGSLKGYDEYAYRMNFAYQPPMQALWVTHPTNGITFQMPVLADKATANEEAHWVSVLAQ